MDVILPIETIQSPSLQKSPNDISGGYVVVLPSVYSFAYVVGQIKRSHGDSYLVLLDHANQMHLHPLFGKDLAVISRSKVTLREWIDNTWQKPRYVRQKLTDMQPGQWFSCDYSFNDSQIYECLSENGNTYMSIIDRVAKQWTLEHSFFVLDKKINKKKLTTNVWLRVSDTNNNA